MKKSILVCGIVFSAFLGVQAAMASNALKGQFKAKYPDFKVVNCKICHEAQPKLNTYGLDLQKNALNFESVEQIDSDGDSFTNLVEIKANTLPGDKNSAPAAVIETGTETGTGTDTGTNW